LFCFVFALSQPPAAAVWFLLLFSFFFSCPFSRPDRGRVAGEGARPFVPASSTTGGPRENPRLAPAARPMRDQKGALVRVLRCPLEILCGPSSLKSSRDNCLSSSQSRTRREKNVSMKRNIYHPVVPRRSLCRSGPLGFSGFRRRNVF